MTSVITNEFKRLTLYLLYFYFKIPYLITDWDKLNLRFSLKSIKLLDLPIFILILFCIKILIIPSPELIIPIVSLSMLSGFCGYIKYKQSCDKIDDADNDYNAFKTNIVNKMEDLQTKVTSMQLAKGFTRK